MSWAEVVQEKSLHISILDFFRSCVHPNTKAYGFLNHMTLTLIPETVQAASSHMTML